MVDGLEFVFLVALRNAGAVARGETGFFETGLGARDFVGNTAMHEEALLEVVEHIAGPGIITGLANAADIHRVAFLGFEACGFFRWLEMATSEGFGIFLPDRGNMRVAIEADECGLRGKVGLGFRVVLDVVELGWFIERGVGGMGSTSA